MKRKFQWFLFRFSFLLKLLVKFYVCYMFIFILLVRQTHHQVDLNFGWQFRVNEKERNLLEGESICKRHLKRSISSSSFSQFNVCWCCCMHCMMKNFMAHLQFNSFAPVLYSLKMIAVYSILPNYKLYYHLIFCISLCAMPSTKKK